MSDCEETCNEEFYITVEETCPDCGNETVCMDYGCPGWVNANGTISSCAPCGNAVEFLCPRCDWGFRYPNNRTNMRGTTPTWNYKSYYDWTFEPFA